MSVGRITHNIMAATANRNMQTANQRLAAAQDQASSLKKLNRPSDNPTDAASAMNVRAQQRANVQFERNTNDAESWLTTADTALSSASDLLNKARQLILNGANDGVLSPQARESIALEVDSLREALLDTANTSYLGRHVFAGTSDQPSAFTADGQWQGIEGATVERRVGSNVSVRVDANGAQAFGTGDSSVFATLENVSAALRSGEPVQPFLEDVAKHHNNVLSVQSSVGAAHSTVLRAQDALGTDRVMLETRRSDLEDADLGSVAMELMSANMAYEASLMTTSRALQTSLMDYLR